MDPLSSHPGLQPAVSEWRALLGESQVLLGEAAQARYGQDTTGAQRQLAVALQITQSGSLFQVMRTATRYKVPVYPISTGHNWGYGTALPAREGSVLIDLSRLQKIIHFDTELGVVTLEPGVTQGMLADYLAQNNLPFLVPVTGAGPSCSLLSNALERGYGVTPYIDHFGAVTDIEAVLPDGSVYRTALREAGGEELARLFKYGIGPYSQGLFTQGGFGIVTRMSIVLARRPERVQACLFSLKDESLLEPAVLRIRAIMGKLQGTIGGLNLMNRHRMLSMSAPYPWDELGPDGVMPPEVVAALGKQYNIFPWTGFATMYGTKRMVAAAQAEIKEALAGIATRMMFFTPEKAKTLHKVSTYIPGKIGQGLQGLTGTLAKGLELVYGTPNETALPLAYWRNRRGKPANAAMNPGADGCGLMWYAPLVPMRLEPLITFTTLGDKLFDSTVPLVFERDKPEAVAAAHACYDELLQTGRAQGWFPYRVGVDTMGKLTELQSDSWLFHDRLRKDLDPHDILAPGRYR
jgi:4-cresol dehydrogenase (hydroxylating) flavoprotein subunit